MRKKVMDEAQEKAAKRRLRKVVEEETAKFLAHGGEIKSGPRVARPMSAAAFPETQDFTEVMARYAVVGTEL